MEWIWYFLCYSLAGFVLEVGYALCTGGRRDRKAGLLLPLCPVYGLGACAVLALPAGVREEPALLFVLGGAAASGVEYAAAVLYQRLGVSFWDYTGLPGSVQGRICLPFSLAWGALAVALTVWVHPLVESWTGAVPPLLTLAAGTAAAADLLVAGVMMGRTGSRDCLRWYSRGREEGPARPG